LNTSTNESTIDEIIVLIVKVVSIKK